MARPDFDEACFIAALTRHQPVLEAFCHANLASRHDAHEVLQATCVKLWEKAADWNAESEFLPWAFSIARFTLLSRIRDKMRDRLVFDEDVVLAMAQETEAVATEFDDRREALGTCIDPRVRIGMQLGSLRQAALCPHAPALAEVIVAASTTDPRRSWTDMNPTQAAILALCAANRSSLARPSAPFPTRSTRG